jgi:hypothetical protein
MAAFFIPFFFFSREENAPCPLYKNTARDSAKCVKTPEITHGSIIIHTLPDAAMLPMVG